MVKSIFFIILSLVSSPAWAQRPTCKATCYLYIFDIKNNRSQIYLEQEVSFLNSTSAPNPDVYRELVGECKKLRVSAIAEIQAKYPVELQGLNIWPEMKVIPAPYKLMTVTDDQGNRFIFLKQILSGITLDRMCQ